MQKIEIFIFNSDKEIVLIEDKKSSSLTITTTKLKLDSSILLFKYHDYYDIKMKLVTILNMLSSIEEKEREIWLLVNSIYIIDMVRAIIVNKCNKIKHDNTDELLPIKNRKLWEELADISIERNIKWKYISYNTEINID